MTGRQTRLGFAALITLLAAGCTRQPLSTLDPAGPAAASIAQVWWVMLVGGILVYLLVVVLAFYATVHRRRTGQAPVRWLLVGGGLVLPLGVTLALLVYGIQSGQSMLPLPTKEPIYRVEVRGHQWWWEVIYLDAPGGPRYSANELHIPAGRFVDVHVSTEDVIHSFWAPRLGGKIDAIPGRTNIVRLRADEPGVYHGVCAEFCGAQHARMRLVIEAHDEAGLAQRLGALDAPASASVALARLSAPAAVTAATPATGTAPEPVPTDSAPASGSTTHAAQAFARDCLACHSLDPAARSAQPGPNLADLHLRTTLAAGTLPNTPEGLRDWLAHHQARKPGNRMPDQNLSAEDVEAIATFLESLP